MNELTKYIKKEFKTFDNSEESQNELVQHFKEVFNVAVKIEECDNGFYYMFRYSHISSDFSNKIVQQCRGTVLFFDGSWDIVARPFDKFFNIGDPLCPVKPDSIINLEENYLLEKLDGTCIQVWEHQDKVHISTLGTITTLNVQDCNITYEELFYETLGKTKEEFNDFLININNYTMLFELCTGVNDTDRNRVLTKYDKDCINLIAIRHKYSGYYFDRQQLERCLNKAIKKGLNIKLPQRFNYKNLDDTKKEFSVQEIVKFLEKETSDSKKYGEIPEGGVLYNQENIPIAKLKLDKYLKNSRFSGFDLACSKNCILETFFENKLDDYKHVFSKRLLEYAESLEKEYLEVVGATHKISHLLNKNYNSQKDYAADVMKFTKEFGIPEFMGFFFASQTNYLDMGSSETGYRRLSFFENCTRDEFNKNQTIKKFKKKLKENEAVLEKAFVKCSEINGHSYQTI